MISNLCGEELPTTRNIHKTVGGDIAHAAYTIKKLPLVGMNTLRTYTAVLFANDSAVVVLLRHLVAAGATDLETLVTLHNRRRRCTHMAADVKDHYRRAGICRMVLTARCIDSVNLVVVELVIGFSQVDKLDRLLRRIIRSDHRFAVTRGEVNDLV
jgi:hypothetical protein